MEAQRDNRDIHKDQVTILNFSFEPYDDIILVTGKKRSGKSFFAKKMASQFKRVIIWDYNWEHTAPKAEWFKKNPSVIVHTIQQLKEAWLSYSETEPRKIIFQPINKDSEAFNNFCLFINQRVVYCCIYIEELQNVTTAVKIPEQFAILMDSGRHKKLGLLLTTRSNKFIPTRLIDSADYIFMFKQQRKETYDYMKNYVEPDKIEALKQSPNYFYICYDGKNSGETYLCNPVAQ